MLFTPRASRFFLAAALPLLLADLASAQKKKLSLEDLTSEPPLAGRPITGIVWLPDGDRFSFLSRRGEGEDAVAELILGDAKTGARTTVAAAETLAIPEEPKPGEVARGVERQPAKSSGTAAESERPARRARRVSLEGYRWSPDGKTVLLSGDNDLWLYHVAEKRLERLTHDKDAEQFPLFSPDGKRVSFVRRGDLHVLDVASREEKRLTTDGAEHVFNGKLDWVYEEELANRTGRAYEWSPDSSAIAYLRLDETKVDSYPLVDFLKVPAALIPQRYPKAGTANSLVSFRVVGADGSPRGGVDLGGDVYVEPAFSWTRDSKAVCYRVLNRAQDRHEIRLMSVPGGESRVLFVEQDPYWINVFDPPKFLKDGRYVWKSERDGFAHITVGSAAGGEPKAITSGKWVVDRIVGVDEAKKLVYFTANEEDVRRRGLYRVSLDGSGFARLPLPPGTHSGELSPDGRYLLDTFSTLSSPPELSLLEASTGRAVRVVDRPESRLADYELASAEEVLIPAQDGVRLTGRLLKPAGFDPSRKYPVIVYVYGGPHAQVVRDAWANGSLFDHYLASKGFLIWSLDNRGSWARGHAWETAIFKETGKRELSDQLAGVTYLKSLPYVDPARIGIWGWSYGGYLTLYSLTRAPEVWKCGVAGAPVTDWKFYDTIYTERYMRTQKENPQGYEASAPLSKARDLKAKLLLIHGTADDNVHMQNTLAFVDALTKAGKPYQLEIQPGQKHGFRGKDAVNFRNLTIAKFFEENL